MKRHQSVGFPKGAMLRVSIFLVALLLLTCPLTVSVVQAESLLDVYRQAQTNDPTTQTATFARQISKEGRKQAISRLLPTLSGAVDYSFNMQDIVSSDNEVFGAGQTDFSTTSYSLTLTQPVFRWDRIVGLKQSKLDTLRADAELVLAQQELMVRVVDLYLQALAAQDRLTFANAEQNAIEKHYELASNRHEMGLIPVTDLHDAKARLAATRAKTIAARILLDDALQALEEMTAEPVTELTPLNNNAPMHKPEPADPSIWIDQALQQNAAVILNKHAVEVARQEVRRQKSGHVPTLDLIGQFQNEETDGTLFGGGSEVETTKIMLQLQIPLYQGGYVSSRVREAKLQLDSALQELEKQQRSVKRQTRSANLGVESDLSRISALQQSVVSNQLALDAKQEGFMSGLHTSLNVLDAERDLSLVSIDYAQARYDYILNSLKLKQAAGTLNDQDMQDLDQWFSK